MTSNKLASARSIFEQNIQKNKEAGCHQSILGQNHKPVSSSSSSRKVTRRLFASQALSDSSNNSNGNSNSNNNLDTSRSSTSSSVRRRRISSLSSSSPERISSASTTNHSQRQQQQQQQQPKGELTAEQKTRTEAKSSSVHEQEPQNLQPSNNSNNGSNSHIKLRPSRNFRVHDALSKSDTEERRERSISSLADHLEKLNLPNLVRSGGGRPSRGGAGGGDNISKGDDASSQASIESHRNRITLPVFRQSSYARTPGSTPEVTPSRTSSRNSKNDNQQHHDSSQSSPIMDDSSNQSFGVEQLCQSRRPSTSNHNSRASSHSSLSSSSSRRNNHGSSQPVNDGSGASLGGDLKESSVKVKPITSNSSRRNRSINGSKGSTSSHNNRSSNNNNGSKKSREDEAVRAALAHHLVARRQAPPPSWIQPSAVVTDDDESCSNNSRHSMPFKSVPFAKPSIKRHNTPRKNSIRNGNNNSAGSLNSSNETLGSSSSSSLGLSPLRATPPLRRKSSLQRRRRPSATSKLPTLKPSSPPPKPDPEEIALQEEIAALQKQLQEGTANLRQTQEGETFDLRRVQETKDRKLKRIDATKEREKPAKAAASLSKEQEAELKEEYKQAKLTTRQLKQDNARMDDQNRKMKLEVLTTSSSNRLVEESTAEVLQSIREVEALQRQALIEHDQLVQLASTYQRSILDLEEAIDKKESPIRRVKSTRLLYEDKVDLIVDLMQKKCKDYDLVEELTILAAFEDETGWEEGVDSDSETEEHYVTRTPYRNETDLLIPTSSHSLHIFL